MTPKRGITPFRDGFNRYSRDARPRGSQHAFASGHIVPYSPRYRATFAFSAILYPLSIHNSCELLTCHAWIVAG